MTTHFWVPLSHPRVPVQDHGRRGQPVPRVGRARRTVCRWAWLLFLPWSTVRGEGGAVRRWEFVEGGSDKFWEAAVDGVVVTVRYGRSGTDGREQSKEFPTAEAAQAHFAKTVAEKE